MALKRVQTWSTERRREAAEILIALDEMDADDIELDAETLAAIDEGLAEIDRGEFADLRDVEAVYARFKK